MSVFCRQIQRFRFLITHLIATSMPVRSSSQQMLVVQKWQGFMIFVFDRYTFSFPRPGHLLTMVEVLCRLTAWGHAKESPLTGSRLITFYVSVLSPDPTLSLFNNTFNCHIHASTQLLATNACCPKMARVHDFRV